MKRTQFYPQIATCIAAMAIAATPTLKAADGFWNVNAAGNWTESGNWLSGIPGSTATNTNPDIATFSFGLNTTRIVTVDTNRNIGGISFGNTDAGGYSLRTGNLLLSNGGVIQTLTNNGNHTDTILAAMAIQGNSGSAAFTAGATSADSLLSITGAVTGVSTAGNTTTLTLNGSNTGFNAVGSISDGVAGGKVAVVKEGAGTWQLGAGGTYTGGLTLNSGVIRINAGSNNLLGPSGGSFALNGGELLMATAASRTQAVVATVGGDATITSDRSSAGEGLSHGLTTMNIGAHTLTIQGGSNVTSGTAGFVITGETTLTGAATFDVLNSASSVTSLTLGSINGNVDNGGHLLTITGNGSSLINNVLSGNGGLTKSGSGVLTLNAANSYSGNTTVTGGTLLLAASATINDTPVIQVQAGATMDASAVTGGFTLKSGQTLQNGGTFTGSLTALDGSTYAPGNSPGIATQAGNLALNTGSTFQWELVANSAALPGTNFDQTQFTSGGLTIQSGVIADLVFSSGSVNWNDEFWDSNQSWTLFTGASSRDTVLGIFGPMNISLDSQDQNFSVTGGSFNFSTSGNDVLLNYVIPEPSSMALLAITFMATTVFRRRRPATTAN